MKWPSWEVALAREAGTCVENRKSSVQAGPEVGPQVGRKEASENVLWIK